MIAEILTTAFLAVIAPHLGEAQTVRCTCYLPTGNRTADGTVPYEGIIAANREHLGDMAILLTLEGEYIAMMECRDCGGSKMLRNGTAIDVFREDMDAALEWVEMYGDYVQIIWIKAEG